MPINVDNLSDVEQEVSPDFDGRQPVSLTGVVAENKGGEAQRTWFRLEWAGDAGQKAGTSFQWFNAPDTDGRKKANDISWHQVVKPLAKAAGLNDGDMPKKSSAGIAKFLNAYENKLRVSAIIGEENGYKTAGGFRAA